MFSIIQNLISQSYATYLSVKCKGSKDSDECLQSSPDWNIAWTCRNTFEDDPNWCSVNSYAKDMRRCCPETCGTGVLTEEECNSLQNSSGTCLYPNTAQCLEERKSYLRHANLTRPSLFNLGVI